MKSRFPKGGGSAKSPKKIPKNFILVNLPAREQAEMRAMARELGQTLRDWINFAVRDVRRELLEEVKLARLSGLDWRTRAKLVGCNVRN